MQKRKGNIKIRIYYEKQIKDLEVWHWEYKKIIHYSTRTLTILLSVAVYGSPHWPRG